MIDSVTQIFAEIPSRFDPEKWGAGDAVLQFNISGDDGGNWTTTIDQGKLTVAEGTVAAPSLTITCTDQDLLAMVNGELNAVSAYMQGRVKIDGNMSLAIKLQNLLSAERG